MRNISDKGCRENKTHILRSITFFSQNRVFYEIMSKNMVERERSHMTTQYGACAFACWISKARRAFAHAHAHKPGHSHTGTHAHTHKHAPTGARTHKYTIIIAFAQWPGVTLLITGSRDRSPLPVLLFICLFGFLL
jgi:4-hydroxyphenylpyruvate dioxygenase-like putative hemolysin